MKRSGLLQKFEMYIISLCLLFLLIIVITVDPRLYVDTSRIFVGWGTLLRRNGTSIAALLFLLYGIFCYFRFKYRVSGSASIPARISSVSSVDYEHLTFLTTYIIPLVCLDLSRTRYTAVLIMLLVVTGIIYIRTDKYYGNPSLALLGFKLYSAVITKRNGEEAEAVIISLDRLSDGSSINYIRLDQGVYFAREAK